VRDSRRKAAHITKDAYELQGKIINPAFWQASAAGCWYVGKRAKKRRGWKATPEPPLGGWRSHYPAPERRKEIFQLPVFRLANFGPTASKLAQIEYNNYLIFLPIVNTIGAEFFTNH
jgi:hypothetical protein